MMLYVPISEFIIAPKTRLFFYTIFLASCKSMASIKQYLRFDYLLLKLELCNFQKVPIPIPQMETIIPTIIYIKLGKRKEKVVVLISSTNTVYGTVRNVMAAPITQNQFPFPQ